MARSIARDVRGASGMVTTLPHFEGDRQRPVPAFQAQQLDVGAGCFGDPQPVQREQGDQRVLGSPLEHALISLLALNGLPVSEATAADIEHLGLERGTGR